MSTETAAVHVPHVAHHFENAEQQKQSNTLGMWVFLATEVMFFGGLFGAYTVYRCKFTPAFVHASEALNLTLGALNTTVLLTSSLMMALAVRSAQTGKRTACMFFLVVTILCGLTFLGVKAVEWTADYREGLVPGTTFTYPRPFVQEAGAAQAAEKPLPDGVTPENMQLFMVLYFAMTGLHAFHMLVGVGILSWMLIWAKRRRFSPQSYTAIELSGLYWHFVDIVWVFLFPLLYLIGSSGR